MGRVVCPVCGAKVRSQYFVKPRFCPRCFSSFRRPGGDRDSARNGAWSPLAKLKLTLVVGAAVIGFVVLRWLM
jgi:hypothetical protein